MNLNEGGKGKIAKHELRPQSKGEASNKKKDAMMPIGGAKRGQYFHGGGAEWRVRAVEILLKCEEGIDGMRLEFSRSFFGCATEYLTWLELKLGRTNS